MSPFLMTLTSGYDHWMYVSSTGCLTAGRSEAQYAIFPYVTDDLLHKNAHFTGPVTLIQCKINNKIELWQPFFNYGQFDNYERNLFKGPLGDQIIFEEINHKLGLRFSYSWQCSEKFGFIRNSKIENISNKNLSVNILDGLMNIMPNGISLRTQQEMSNLANAYKVSEIIDQQKFALFYLNSLIMDRPEPGESLKTTWVWSDYDQFCQISLNDNIINDFRNNRKLKTHNLLKGKPGSFLMNFSLEIKKNKEKSWNIITDTNKSQNDVSKMLNTIEKDSEISFSIKKDIQKNHLKLKKFVFSADGKQLTNKKINDMHHTANVLFNIMRGGVFYDNYNINKYDFLNFIKIRNLKTYKNNLTFFDKLPKYFTTDDILKKLKSKNKVNLLRLSLEYLPLTFGRRHGDPSRPWNHFKIKTNDNHGEQLYYYEGNWRDIFQNWEALLISYPKLYQSMIAKFLNATTIDGYNPYRITSEGIDWEVEDVNDPWSYIGYWSDHQIIYLLKLLEHFKNINLLKLQESLGNSIFCYSNLPYELKDFSETLSNPKSTIIFNHNKNDTINRLIKVLGSDGKLVLKKNQTVYHVNMCEKLLVLLLAKLSNFIPNGGIWMNTQRPEWNDANNALVGYGLSMVTVGYLKRFISFFIDILKTNTETSFKISFEVINWFKKVNEIFSNKIEKIDSFNPKTLMNFVAEMGIASSDYRTQVYQFGFKKKSNLNKELILEFLTKSNTFLKKTIKSNLNKDNLYNAYNILKINLNKNEMKIEGLYPMLEGQVSTLSSGTLKPEESINILKSIFKSKLYRKNQNSFLLYPEPSFKYFLEKNIIPKNIIKSNTIFNKILKNKKSHILEKNNNTYRFHRNIINIFDLEFEINNIKNQLITKKEKKILFETYEMVFQHMKYTGRSGTMFSYEGIGSIYWHMVSKLLLSIQEVFFKAVKDNTKIEYIKTIGELYYRVRSGLSTNKSPAEYGAFPFDPYSHTPSHSGAQQPGMTGQVKEEILSRYGELGIFVSQGRISFIPTLLKKSEFLKKERTFYFNNIKDKPCEIPLKKNELAFTYCQVPIIYILSKKNNWLIEDCDKNSQINKTKNNTLNLELSKQIFERKNNIKYLKLYIPEQFLLF